MSRHLQEIERDPEIRDWFGTLAETRNCQGIRFAFRSHAIRYFARTRLFLQRTNRHLCRLVGGAGRAGNAQRIPAAPRNGRQRHRALHAA